MTPKYRYLLMDARAFDVDPYRRDRAVVYEACESLQEAIRNAPEYGDDTAIHVCRFTGRYDGGQPVYEDFATATVDEARAMVKQ